MMSRKSIILSVLLHALLVALLLFGFKFHTEPVSVAPPAPVMNATLADSAAVDEQVKQLKAKDEAAKAEKERQVREAEEKRRAEKAVSVWDRSMSHVDGKRDMDPNFNAFIREPGHIEYAGKLGLGVYDQTKIKHTRIEVA